MNKYRNVKVGGYDSKKELRRFHELEALEKAGEITNLQRQVEFLLIPSQRIDGKVVERAVTYKADFIYTMNGELVVEDVKSKITAKDPTFIIKRKLMLKEYGIRVKVVI